MSPVAAIDIGTNSTRLLVLDAGEATNRQMRTTRLGAGVGATGRLDDAAIERTVEALREYRAICDELGVTALRVAATSASRDATNRDEFFDRAEAVLRARPELLSGTEEAELSFRGATKGITDAAVPFGVIDIGGGSTEFAVGSASVETSTSLDIGAVRMTEAYLESDPPAPDELSGCLSVIEVFLEEAAREHPALGSVKTWIAVAGTATTAAAVDIGLPAYDRSAVHHYRLTKDAAEDVFRTLATETVEERKDNPGLDPNRADIIVGGMCVLVKTMRYFAIDELLISESDILDGLAGSIGGDGA